MKVAKARANGSASGPIAGIKAAAVPTPTPQGAVRPQAPTSAAAPAALQGEAISPVVVPESAVEAQQDDVSLDTLCSHGTMRSNFLCTRFLLHITLLLVPV